jgi:hypothetical protein
MASKLVVLNPVAQLASELGESLPLPQRPGTLEGCRVGLYWNRKQGGNFALERVGQLLQQRYPGVQTRLYNARRPISEDLLRDLKASWRIGHSKGILVLTPHERNPANAL